MGHQDHNLHEHWLNLSLESEIDFSTCCNGRNDCYLSGGGHDRDDCCWRPSPVEMSFVGGQLNVEKMMNEKGGESLFPSDARWRNDVDLKLGCVRCCGGLCLCILLVGGDCV